MRNVYIARDCFSERFCILKSENGGQHKLHIQTGTIQECRTMAAAFVMIGYAVVIAEDCQV